MNNEVKLCSLTATLGLPNRDYSLEVTLPILFSSKTEAIEAKLRFLMVADGILVCKYDTVQYTEGDNEHIALVENFVGSEILGIVQKNSKKIKVLETEKINKTFLGQPLYKTGSLSELTFDDVLRKYANHAMRVNAVPCSYVTYSVKEVPPEDEKNFSGRYA